MSSPYRAPGVAASTPPSMSTNASGSSEPAVSRQAPTGGAYGVGVRATIAPVQPPKEWPTSVTRPASAPYEGASRRDS